MSSPIPEIDNFLSQRDAEPLAHRLPAPLDEPAHIRGCRRPVIDDEIGVLLRHRRLADAKALEIRALDQARRVIFRRIGEYGSAAPLTDGLRLFALVQELPDGVGIDARLAFELELRAAVATDQIEVYFQPIVSVATRQIVGFEALARWRSTLLGPVSPAEFIPIVEEIGLMEEMGAAMLRRACKASISGSAANRAAARRS